MNISSIQVSLYAYQRYSESSVDSIANESISSSSNQSASSSSVTPLRDRIVSQIKKTAGDEQKAEQLLQSYSKPNNGGILVAASNMPNLKDVEAIRRFESISNAFERENAAVEQQKTELIANGKEEGKTTEEILTELVNFYDSQSDLYKTGIGWEGSLFSFNNSSSIGWEKTLEQSPTVVDTFA
ncbi:hypothetical protein [Desulfogranum japonicum]|uniref:hypothetical protein n=1 Tax=Desulfogranum japonicum TaxID=231447 RepID=UPI001294719C|nr:hypothetical protein [Desulfogranum japonicum]